MLGKTARGRYRLVRLLGSGANGEVFLAEPLQGDGWVVVKRVHDHVVSHPKFRQLFEAEVRSMANFSHPYAVRLLDASLTDPIGPCLVLEYVPGLTLEQVLRVSRTLSVGRVGRLLGQFCHALQAAHQAGIIHRDLKPENLMVQNPGTPDESLKVMDFGFAGFTAKPYIQLAELTGRGSLYAIGTPGYVSPEMIRGDRVDTRSDLYAVGVILYELLTGRHPYPHDDQNRLLAAHRDQPPPRFARVGAGHLPVEIEATVLLALSKYPNERQQTARELVEMYGKAVAEDYWAATEPVGWEPVRAAVELTPPPRDDQNTTADAFRITHVFEVSMPERLAAAKLRGFVDDAGGRVLASEPGIIRMRVGQPPGSAESRESAGSGLFRWFRPATKPGAGHGQEPIEVELHLQKPDPSQTRLSVRVAFYPLKDSPPKDLRQWRTRCDQLHATLRQYLGA